MNILIKKERCKMALWNNNQEDLTTKTGTGEKIEVSGVYELEIKEAYLTNSKTSKAVGITLNFDGDAGYARTTLWHIKGDGTVNKFAEKYLNRMLYLLKTKVENLKTEVKKVKLFSGEEVDRTFITNIPKKAIGVILEVKKDQENTNYEIKDFYDIGTGKTTDEIMNKTEAVTVQFFKDKFEKVAPKKGYPLPYETTKNIITEDDEEFPF